MDPVRLACLIHATSVRSEPESNSQKKNYCFVIWKASRPSGLSHKLLSCVPRPFRSLPSGRRPSGAAPFQSTYRVSMIGVRAPGGGERGHSLPYPAPPRKGENEKNSKNFCKGIFGGNPREFSLKFHVFRRFTGTRRLLIDSSFQSSAPRHIQRRDAETHWNFLCGSAALR